MRYMRFLCFICIAFLSSCKEKTSNPTTLHEVIYHQAPDFRGDTVPLNAFLEVPPSTGKLRPLLILVHGGGFVAGSPNQAFLRHIARYFAERGYVTARISYRL